VFKTWESARAAEGLSIVVPTTFMVVPPTWIVVGWKLGTELAWIVRPVDDRSRLSGWEALTGGAAEGETTWARTAGGKSNCNTESSESHATAAREFTSLI
jgi:hypothetical protein